MVNKYTISVKNNCGDRRKYAIFNEPPRVIGKVQDKIWSNVFATGNTPDGSQANFEMYTQYYAIVGTSKGTPAASVKVDVTGWQDVVLGSTEPTGKLVPGTTLALKVDQDAPSYDKNRLPNSSFVDSFEVRCGNDFTIPQAEQGNYIIGLGGSKTGRSNDGPTATFTPQPGVSYQIQPSNKYYVTFGEFESTALIDVAMLGGNTVLVDFAQLKRPNAVIVHNANGRLILQEQ